ncbi:hypothetical protein D9M68_735400 [compost metagenome]
MVDLALRFHAIDPRLDHARLGGELAQQFLDLREAGSAVDLGDAVRQADQEAQLDHQPHLALVVLVDVRRRGMELLRAHGDVARDEDPLPRHLDVVEVEHRIVLVEAAGQRVVEDRGGIGLVGLARHHLQALAVHRHREGQRIHLVALA